MPLKLNVGLTKKIGQPHFGSLAASCHLELELEASLLENDTNAFRLRAERAFDACRRAVEDELTASDLRRPRPPSTRIDAENEDKRDQQAARPIGPLQDDCDHNRRRAGAERNNVVSSDNGAVNFALQDDPPLTPASKSQLDYVRRLASRIGRAAALRVEILAQRRFGKPLRELSRDEATRLILTLRAVKSGKLDWETVLDESAA